MFEIVSNFTNPIIATSMYEAQIIMGREYNLKLADILTECSIANPVRYKTDYKADILWKGKVYRWEIRNIEDNAA